MIAACREPTKSIDLQDLASTLGGDDRLDIVKLDVTDQTGVDFMFEYMKANYGVRAPCELHY